MRLTKNFELEEFAVSKEHPDLAARIQFTPKDTEKIRALCHYILQPLRNHLCLPIIITSGKRTTALNNAVGGAMNSDHLYDTNSGAVDFTCEKLDSAWRWIMTKANCIKFAYLDRGKNFIHVSIPDDSLQYGKTKEL